MRVLIADDHYVFREGLRTLLGTVEGVEVVGEAGTYEDVIAAAQELHPDLVLMDLQMPGGTGIAATRLIRDRLPDARILVLTMFGDDDHVTQAIAAGAHGYLLKDAGPAELLRSLESVVAGQFVLGSGVARHPRAVLARGHAPRPLPELSDRELEVLDLMAAGQGNEAIARRLGLTLKTVRNYVSTIYAKLLVADRTQAVITAREAGLGRRQPGVTA